MTGLTILLAFFSQLFPFPGPGRSGGGGGATTARSFAGSSFLSSTSTGYFAGASSFTIAYWFKSADVTQTNTYVIEFGNGNGDPAIIYGYANDGSGHAQLELYFGFFRSGSQVTIADTNWHHVAYRYDGTEFAKFLDGSKTIVNASLTGTLGNSPIGLWIGAANNSGSGIGFVQASLARLYFSSAALSDGQITSMAGPTCSTSGVSGTLGYWLLGTGSPETESSPSGGSNSLTVPGSGTSIVTGPTCSSQ
jgi:hypothetical protein